MLKTRLLKSKVFVAISIIFFTFPILIWHHHSLKDLSVSYPRPHARPVPQFMATGDSRCLPEVTQELIEEATSRRATCRKYSPFVTGRARIATVTAHFGKPDEHYRKAFRTHLLHSLIHGTEVRVLCDRIIDDLWNKPAFILSLLMHEMLKPARERLEWIQWADRDVLILDQCRPVTNFLPPENTHGSWWHSGDDNGKFSQPLLKATHLLVNSDFNGLNNGVFLLRVNSWAVDLFSAILAFRQYKPYIELPYTEQSAMEYVLRTPQFVNQTRFVPQHWFNAYEHGGPLLYESREDEGGLAEPDVRRGDYLVHYAGNPNKATAIKDWTSMLERLGDVWEKASVQRDVSEEVARLWKEVESER